MATFRRKGERTRYQFLDARCIGRTCWAPGEYQHRGGMPSGSRNTGDVSHVCMTRAYHGCPTGPEDFYKISNPEASALVNTGIGLPLYQIELSQKRKK